MLGSAAGGCQAGGPGNKCQHAIGTEFRPGGGDGAAIDNYQKDSIFFVQHWKNGYYQLRSKLIRGFATGQQWVAKVDLSAFYETVPHDLLLRTAFAQGGGAELSMHFLETSEFVSSSQGFIELLGGFRDYQNLIRW